MFAFKNRPLFHFKEARDFNAILKEVKKIFLWYYSGKSFRRVEKVFQLVIRLFEGKIPGFIGIQSEYHNISHTMNTFLTVSRLLDGYNLSGQKFREITAVRLFQAALLNDTGFFLSSEARKAAEKDARGVIGYSERSVKFLKSNLELFGVHEQDFKVIGKIITCTRDHLHWDVFNYDTMEEEVAGAILRTSDLLSRMADQSYLDKLLFLHLEYREEYSEEYEEIPDVERNTKVILEGDAKHDFSTSLLGVYSYARRHFEKRYGIDHNLYMDAMERNMEYLNRIIEKRFHKSQSSLMNSLNRKEDPVEEQLNFLIN